jgi:hypothetical protein
MINKMWYCSENAGYIPQMPTDPGKLLAFLNRIGITNTQADGSDNGPASVADDIGKDVDDLMQTTYLLPAQQAALFELMARTPGFTVVHGVRDAVGCKDCQNMPKGWLSAYAGDALIKITVVNRAGQLP